jgi:hypothetical protein
MHTQTPQLFRTAFALLLAAGIAACSTAGAPSGEAEVRAFIEESLGLIATGLQREDAVLASAPASDQFVMGSNVAIRYLDAGWNGQGIGALRGFFSAAFQTQQNISQQFRLASLELVGGVATAVVVSEYSSVRVDRVPPENTTASGEDIMVFQLEDSGWRLVSWDQPLPPEAPPPE